MTEKNSVRILDIPFVHTTLEEMTHTLYTHAVEKEKAFVVTANPEIAWAAHHDPEKKKLLEEATYVTADGIGVVKAAKWSGQSLPERVTGFELFINLLEKANERGQSVYLLGAKAEVIEKAADTIRATYPNVQLAGFHHGYFDWDDPSIANDIAEKQPDYVFLALGFPRQETWVASHYDKFNHGVFMGIGGSFDVLAGEVKRAPVIWQKFHIEWLYRLFQQPARWRRMLAIPKFVFAVRRHRRQG
ncbi:N-acetylglucosaminyldiphosphoundecaprenol N-acetyl-beta-D-mannosaminyltransferase [Salsuginibacillus halophilus]|uniref:N-acetylglucosaminyldiphosphoundecaprenol N-acetyl-beta-D-mannosaminyltransferase n=1 Tax=Salsuginibacillus halophilus TaxID=517424 RepID=A0A2P8HQR5_9BACI|nr:WecB/TagA/CpsF family glycosyltransferase [Salsuginibacillus halophilus]PSL48524.1 N-acetylglucosaminyldiphosphoundecaprenol N-acetyl-beta-D-mannosaminyltransferase [Salsuginibacillus halophilus]